MEFKKSEKKNIYDIDIKKMGKEHHEKKDDCNCCKTSTNNTVLIFWLLTGGMVSTILSGFLGNGVSGGLSAAAMFIAAGSYSCHRQQVILTISGILAIIAGIVGSSPGFSISLGSQLKIEDKVEE